MVATDERFLGELVVVKPTVRVGDVAHFRIEHGDSGRCVLDESGERRVRAHELQLGMPALGYVNIGVEVSVAGNGDAGNLEHLAGVLIPFLDDRNRTQKRLEPVGDCLLHGKLRSVVAALGAEANERLELRMTVREQRLGQIEQRPVEPVAHEPSVAIDERDAAGEIVDHRLQRLRLLADQRDVGADGDEPLDRAFAIEARDDDRFKPDIGAALAAIAELAAPGSAGVHDVPHLLERFRRVLAGAQHLIRLPEEL